MSSTLLNSLPSETKSTMANAIQQAIKDGLQAFFENKPLVTNNGKPYIAWDCINSSLTNQTCLESHISKKGAWQFVLLFDPRSNFLFSIMRKKRFDMLYKSKNKAQPKYIQDLLVLNKKLQARSSQTDCFGIQSDSSEAALDTALQKLIENFNAGKDINNIHHALIVFDYEGTDITSLNLYVLDRNFNRVEEENLLDLINITPIMEPVPNRDDSPSLTLTPYALKIREQQRTEHG